MYGWTIRPKEAEAVKTIEGGVIGIQSVRSSITSLMEKTICLIYSSLRSCFFDEWLGGSADQFGQLWVHELVVVWNVQDFDGQKFGLARIICEQSMAMLVLHYQD